MRWFGHLTTMAPGHLLLEVFPHGQLVGDPGGDPILVEGLYLSAGSGKPLALSVISWKMEDRWNVFSWLLAASLVLTRQDLHHLILCSYYVFLLIVICIDVISGFFIFTLFGGKETTGFQLCQNIPLDPKPKCSTAH